MVGKLVAPRGRLTVEIEEIGEASAGPESISDEADRSFYSSLLMRAPDVAGDHAEAAAHARELEKVSIEAGCQWRVREHHRLHIVKEAHRRRSAEERQRPVHAPHERAERLAHRELDVEQPRVAEHRNERADAPRTAW